MTPFYTLTALCMEAALFACTNFPTKFLTHFKVYGKKNLEHLPSGAVIIMANHASQLDPGFLNMAVPWTRRLRPVFVVSLEKKEYLHLPLGRLLFGGKFFWLGGSYPAYKKRPTLDESLPHHLAVLAQGKVVAIFPEGKMSLDGKFNYAHPGVALMAHKSNATVIPAYIGGDYLMTVKNFFTRRRTVSVTFGKPIRFSDYLPLDGTYTRLDYREVAEKMFEEVKKLA